MRRVVLLPVVIVVLGLPLRAEVLEQVLVKVNGEIITKTDLEQRQIAALRQRNRQFTADELKNDESLKKILAEITPEIIVDAVDELLLTQRGRELGYKLGDEQFKAVVENIKKENKIESEEQFQAALKQEGMTMDDLRRSLERQMLISRVQQTEVLGRISLTEEERKKYYQEHPEEFEAASTVSLREILIVVGGNATASSTPPAINVAQDEEAQAKATAARNRVLGGEDFAKVAAEVSDAPSKANGGLIGPVNRRDLAPAFLEIVAKLKAGEVSEVVRTPRGYLVLKLESSTEATVQPYAQVQEQIADKIFTRKRQAEFDKYMEKLRAQAIIEWKNAELKKAYDQRLQELAANRSNS